MGTPINAVQLHLDLGRSPLLLRPMSLFLTITLGVAEKHLPYAFIQNSQNSV